MSLNIGGLYVGVKKGVTAAAVAAVIDAHWRAIGAKPYDGDPLEIPPLSLTR